MRCGKVLKYFVLVLLLLSSVYCYSLSQDEINKLPTLTKGTLTLIILEYDQALTDLEKSINDRETELNLKEKNLNLKEKELNQTEKLLIQQGELFQTSLEMQKQILTKTRIIYSIVGFGSGYITRGFFGQ